MNIGFFISLSLSIYGLILVRAKVTKHKMTQEDFFSSFYFGVLGHAFYNQVFGG